MLLKKLLNATLFISCFGLISLPAQAEMVTAVNLTNSSIDFSVNGGGGPSMSPNSDASASGGACCAYMPSWSPNLKVTVKWEADQDPFSSAKNPFKPRSKEWREWYKNNKKENRRYYKAEVIVPEYTKETAGDVIAIFLPCNQVMVVNTLQRYKSPNFPEKAKIQQRLNELTALEKSGNCPTLQFPAKQSSY